MVKNKNKDETFVVEFKRCFSTICNTPMISIGVAIWDKTIEVERICYSTTREIINSKSDTNLIAYPIFPV